jgi:PTS system nitrogen regulatory IIA component
MELGDLVTRDAVIAALPASNKKQVLLELANTASQHTGLDRREIFDALQQRERLGSTGFGRGVAIPHVKLSKLERTVCLFARLEAPVDFDSLDGEMVDLIFLLLSPEHASGDHLKTLARISRLVRDPAAIERLRRARDAIGIHRVLTADTVTHAA